MKALPRRNRQYPWKSRQYPWKSGNTVDIIDLNLMNCAEMGVFHDTIRHNNNRSNYEKNMNLIIPDSNIMSKIMIMKKSKLSDYCTRI